MNPFTKHAIDGAALGFRLMALDKQGMSKMAKDAVKKIEEESPEPSMSDRIGEGGVGLIGGGIAGSMGMSALGGMMSGALRGNDPVDLESMQKKMVPGMDMKTHQTAGKPFQATVFGENGPKMTVSPEEGNAFMAYSPDRHGGHIAVPHGTNEAVAAHEFGHAQNRDMIEKAVGKGAGRAAHYANMGASMAANISSPITSLYSAFKRTRRGRRAWSTWHCMHRDLLTRPAPASTPPATWWTSTASVKVSGDRGTWRLPLVRMHWLRARRC